MALSWLSYQISTNHCEVEMSMNVSKHWKTRAKGNEIITNVTSHQSAFCIDFFPADIQIREMQLQARSPYLPCPSTRACCRAGYPHYLCFHSQ